MTANPLNAREIVICTYFTHAGDISPFAANTASPIDFHRRAEACAEAGFCGMGFSLDDIHHVLDRISIADFNATLDRLGLIHRELEVLADWFLDGERRHESDQRRQWRPAAGCLAHAAGQHQSCRHRLAAPRRDQPYRTRRRSPVTRGGLRHRYDQ